MIVERGDHGCHEDGDRHAAAPDLVEGPSEEEEDARGGGDGPVVLLHRDSDASKGFFCRRVVMPRWAMTSLMTCVAIKFWLIWMVLIPYSEANPNWLGATFR